MCFVDVATAMTMQGRACKWSEGKDEQKNHNHPIRRLWRSSFFKLPWPTRRLSKTTQPHALKAVKRYWTEQPQASRAHAHTTIALAVIVISVAVVTMVFKPHAPLPRAMRRYPFSPHVAPQLFLMIQYGFGVEPKPTIATP